MVKSFPWLPIGTKVANEVEIGKVIVAGYGYQILNTTTSDKSILIINANSDWVLPSSDCTSQLEDLIKNGILQNFEFGSDKFWVGIFYQEEIPLKVKDLTDQPDFGSSDDLLNLAAALSSMTKLYNNADWNEALYLPKQGVCLAVESNSNVENRRVLAVKLVTGGVADQSLSPKQMRILNPWMTVTEIKDFFHSLGLSCDDSPKFKSSFIKQPEDFFLPGRPNIESFFREYIIDYFQRIDEYEKLGIKPPNGILLVGASGTGKTYAVKKLSEFLDFPVYDVDPSTIGSPYLHQTSKILGEIFALARENAPSIILMEEIDALAGNRDELLNSNKIEEISQLLRLIEKAAEKRVLVIATSNRLYALDDAFNRKGRFDHIIEVELPTSKELLDALEGLLNERPTVGGLNLDNVVTKLKGRPMSDLAWVVNEAARIAVKSKKKYIDDFCLITAAKKLQPDS